ncbi:MAG TPA: 2-C-methyl-D-erythritol 4-phosphate cytidylyltransferase [Ignavibacteria bacterium]|nr:2-C-methyl-D-erythritol 4-phosphate cytidylyltransferase [Ignavibacteria bacterium]
MGIKLIIPASGSGIRFGSKTPKQFLKIDGKEIIAHTISRFHNINLIDEIIIPAKKEYFSRLKNIIRKNNFYKIEKIVEGGKLRQDSVYRGLINLNCGAEDIILIHDAVRPYISSKKILEIIMEAGKEKCVIPALKIPETVKKVDRKNFVEKTINREDLRIVQTPQAFRFDILKKSFEKAFRDNFTGTDEASIVEHSGYKVKVIEGEKGNIKITEKSDVRR